MKDWFVERCCKCYHLWRVILNESFFLDLIILDYFSLRCLNDCSENLLWNCNNSLNDFSLEWRSWCHWERIFDRCYDLNFFKDSYHFCCFCLSKPEEYIFCSTLVKINWYLYLVNLPKRIHHLCFWINVDWCDVTLHNYFCLLWFYTYWYRPNLYDYSWLINNHEFDLRKWFCDSHLNVIEYLNCLNNLFLFSQDNTTLHWWCCIDHVWVVNLFVDCNFYRDYITDCTDELQSVLWHDLHTVINEKCYHHLNHNHLVNCHLSQIKNCLDFTNYFSS